MQEEIQVWVERIVVLFVLQFIWAQISREYM